MNYLMVSPNFPTIYWRFAEALKANGFNVLGIGDTPFDLISSELKSNLSEYYFLPNMNSYPDLYKAVAFLSFKHGKIEWLESNNEYWLAVDARLREDFNITTGIHTDVVENYKMKSKMKTYFERAKVPTARFIIALNLEQALKFIKRVGYPVFVKPNIGVGANSSYKINNDKELTSFFKKSQKVPYIMEEFIDGEVVSFDGVANSRSEVVFAASSEFPIPNFEIVNNLEDDFYYTVPKLDPDFEKIGRRVVKAFKVKQRFFHIEFFRLNKAKRGLGKKGSIVGLEVNMRPAGGYTPEMINIANSLSCYRVFADVIAFDENRQKVDGEKFYAAEAARRDAHKYVNSHEDVLQKYGSSMAISGRYPPIISDGMGEQFYIVKLKTKKEVEEFREFVLKRK
jgi:hypothetical protein